jgi:hypothetical protein
LSSTGIRHLDHHPAQPLRGQRGHLQRHVGAQRSAPDDRLVDLQVIEQRDDLLAEEGHRVDAHVVRALRAPVPQQVDRDDSVAALGQGARQRRLHRLRQQQAVHEHDHARALAVLGVHETPPLVAERSGPHGDVRHRCQFTDHRCGDIDNRRADRGGSQATR